MKKTKGLLFVILIFAGLTLSACGDDGTAESASDEDEGKTYEFKMSYVTQTGHIWHKFAEKFAEELDAKSDGRMTLDLYPAAQLGPEADMVQQLESGSLDFAVLTVPYLSTRFPELDAWNMPFLFEDLEASLAAQDTEPAQDMLGLLEEQGLRGMDYFFAANHNLLVNGDPITSLDDVDGRKLRFTGGESVLDFWEGLGASPIAMGLPEVYNAMQTGVIEGVSVDTNPMLSEKYHEIGENYVLTNHMAFGGIVTGSQSNYENMPKGDQEILNEALSEAVQWGEEKIVADEDDNLKELEDLVNVIELKNREEFIEEAEKMYEKYSEKNELIKKFIEEVREQ
ncbi:TRAP-type C4-dicarboxylate transport system, substrate-binding protein [Lentibacillus persicus]|uniref:TRAP-type C4-dicarboxylate transport system, substrate-binding protein n=1 Tax=Lentibacillus persicus TaxID=640948 RepID=A0A1I2A405_9BACI|nr:TRAP transporter substrate-binding protein [Lentibacillus persicus]SFE38692.1 TRAP-type C4-dicarboxylate transport system, substrate-binding protein [Lentibacillus persicus]